MKQITTKLTEQQKYLLSRIPRVYDMDGFSKSPEPQAIKRARTLIANWDKTESQRECRVRRRNEALIRKAREAVYFHSPEKALSIIRQCEKLLRGCPV